MLLLSSWYVWFLPRESRSYSRADVVCSGTTRTENTSWCKQFTILPERCLSLSLWIISRWVPAIQKVSRSFNACPVLLVHTYNIQPFISFNEMGGMIVISFFPAPEFVWMTARSTSNFNTIFLQNFYIGCFSQKNIRARLLPTQETKKIRAKKRGIEGGGERPSFEFGLFLGGGRRDSRGTRSQWKKEGGGEFTQWLLLLLLFLFSAKFHCWGKKGALVLRGGGEGTKEMREEREEEALDKVFFFCSFFLESR